ncbi:MAG: 2-hydroxyacid dehydrogenase [Geminicoccaceae bacterium]
MKIAICGDQFMRAQMFETALRERVPDPLEVRSMELPWPDEPMEHGYRAGGTTDPELADLREYQGDPQTIASFIGDARIFIDHLAPVTASMLERLPALEMIAVSRGGPVNIDMGAARTRGIKVVNAPGRNASAVAEFTIGAILAETRLIRAGHEALRKGVWRGDLYRADRTGEELSAMTVGIIGYGHIGTRVVTLLKPFGCRILVDDPYVPLRDEDRADGVEACDLETLLVESDVVSLHARVTPETTGFLSASQFRAMKRGAYFINTARGPMVDYGALYDALAGGHLRGAMLETFGEEPVPPGTPLLEVDTVTLTPHIAGASLTTVRVAAEAIAREVGRHVKGEPPINPC